MRFIDAEKCPCKTCGITYCQNNCKKYYDWRDGCDYDVEKVIKQIQEFAECNDDCKKTFYYGQGCSACAWGKIIEMVRNGGVKK